MKYNSLALCLALAVAAFATPTPDIGSEGTKGLEARVKKCNAPECRKLRAQCLPTCDGDGVGEPECFSA